MSFLFGPAPTVQIELNDTADRRLLDVPKFPSAGVAGLVAANSSNPGEIEKVYLYHGNETVSGKVHVKVPPGKKIEHNGAKIELIGQIELFYDRANHYEFVSLVSELDSAGEMNSDRSFPFEFVNVEKSYESYTGANVRLRYFLRFTINVKKSLNNISKEIDFWVHNYQSEPEINNTIKMEVGIEECLHIEFEYNKSKYHLKDVVIGKVYFLLVRIKIKHMEIALIKRESTGSGPNLYNESETLTKFEIMDGAPVRGESIPVRLFLGGFDLTPTYRNVHTKFSLKYYLNLVLVDEEDRRYFKQQEITLWRKPPQKKKKSVSPAPNDD